MIYQFNDYELDSTNFSLHKLGQSIAVEPQVFDLIVYLLVNREKLVTREEIFGKLWGGREVLDAVLSNHVKNARAVLGDDGKKQNVIKTVHGRGYQFVADTLELTRGAKNGHQVDAFPVLGDSKSSASIIFGKKMQLFVVIILAIVAYFVFAKFWHTNSISITENTPLKQRSIAILPFINRSALEKDVFFTDGIHDDLLTRVSKISQIKTISRTSMMAYRDTIKKIPIIGQELGVETILEGGVQRSGNKIRINVQLIDAKKDVHLWSETYTRELTVENIFFIQSEITEAIVSELKAVLSPQEQQNIEKLPTQNLAALETYFLAKASSSKNSIKGYQEAIVYLNEAIKLDPNFAIAHAELAARYLDQIPFEGLLREKQIAKAQPLIDRAMQLDDRMSHGYRVLAKLRMHQRDFNAGKLAYERAIAINPNNADAYNAYGSYHGYTGNISKAVELLSRAKELNPADDKIANSLARILVKAGRFDKAREVLTNIINRKPDYAQAYTILANVQYYGDNEIAESMLTLRKSMEIDPGFLASPMIIAIRYLNTGDEDIALKWFDYFMAIVPESMESRVTRADIHGLNDEWDEAYDIYLKESAAFAPYLFHFLDAAMHANRMVEAIEHCRTVSPEIFDADVVINTRNFATAFAIGRWYKSQDNSKPHELEHAEILLQKSLKFAQREIHGGFEGKHNNWVGRIQMALGNKELAMASLTTLVEAGHHTEHLIFSSDYDSMHDDPEYKRLLKIVEGSLNAERIKLREMEASGELDIPELPNKGLE